MLANFLAGLTNGIGFMAGVLVIYTIYDGIFTYFEKRREKAEAQRRKKRRH
jgi:dihydroxyacetone kinase